MKKTKLLLLPLLVFGMSMAACHGSGGGEEPGGQTTKVVTGVTLDRTAVSLKAGETVTLKATVEPDGVTGYTITWSTDNSAVATVNNGTVTAVAEGTAKITVTAGGKTASCTVTVTASEGGGGVVTPTLTGITITTEPTKTTYVVGETFDPAGLVVTATMSDGSTKNVTSSVTLTGYDMTLAEDQRVTVSYTEGGVTQTASFYITVTPQQGGGGDEPGGGGDEPVTTLDGFKVLYGVPGSEVPWTAVEGTRVSSTDYKDQLKFSFALEQGQGFKLNRDQEWIGSERLDGESTTKVSGDTNNNIVASEAVYVDVYFKLNSDDTYSIYVGLGTAPLTETIKVKVGDGEAQTMRVNSEKPSEVYLTGLSLTEDDALVFEVNEVAIDFDKIHLNKSETVENNAYFSNIDEKLYVKKTAADAGIYLEKQNDGDYHLWVSGGDDIVKVANTFNINIQTNGKKLFLAGDFSNWKLDDAYQLTWSQDNNWSGTFSFPKDEEISYKYVIAASKDAEEQTWEYGKNRTITIVENAINNDTWHAEANLFHYGKGENWDSVYMAEADGVLSITEMALTKDTEFVIEVNKDDYRKCADIKEGSDLVTNNDGNMVVKEDGIYNISVVLDKTGGKTVSISKYVEPAQPASLQCTYTGGDIEVGSAIGTANLTVKVVLDDSTVVPDNVVEHCEFGYTKDEVFTHIALDTVFENAGDYTIQAKLPLENEAFIVGQFNIKVVEALVPVDSVTVTPENAELDIGGTKTLTATVLPDNASNQSVTWTSSDKTVATVDSDGKVTAVAAGTATITATSVANNEKLDTCAVTVKAEVTNYVLLGETKIELTLDKDAELVGTQTAVWYAKGVKVEKDDELAFYLSSTALTKYGHSADDQKHNTSNNAAGENPNAIVVKQDATSDIYLTTYEDGGATYWLTGGPAMHDYSLIGSTVPLGSWALENAVAMTDTTNKENAESTTYALAKGDEFKVLVDGTWDTTIGYSDLAFSDPELAAAFKNGENGNVKVALGGNYKVTVNYLTGKLDITGEITDEIPTVYKVTVVIAAEFTGYSDSNPDTYIYADTADGSEHVWIKVVDGKADIPVKYTRFLVVRYNPALDPNVDGWGEGKSWNQWPVGDDRILVDFDKTTVTITDWGAGNYTYA